MSPLRINFFVQFVHEQGTYFRFHNLAKALVSMGESVRVFGCDYDKKTEARTEIRDGVTYGIVPSFKGDRLFSPNTNPLNVFRRGVATYRECDIAHLFQPFPSALWAWKKCRSRRRFYDWDDLWTGGFWTGPIRTPRDGFERWVSGMLERALPAWADHTTVCSEYLGRLAKSRGAHNVSLVHNGVWPVSPLTKSEARARLGLQNDAVYAGFMGRTCAELDWCVEALRENIGRHPKLRLAVCGPPTDAFAAVSINVRERIDHLGQLPPAIARNFAAALDFGLLPLQRNPFNESRFPIKMAEYLGAGIPIVCSQIGECAMLTSKLSGVLKAGSTKEEWLRCFEATVAAYVEGKLPSPLKSDVYDIFSWEKIGQKLAGVYREGLTPGRSSSIPDYGV